MGLKETWYVSFPPFTLVVLRGGAAFAHMIVPHFGATSVGQAMLQGAWSLVDWWELMAPKFHPWRIHRTNGIFTQIYQSKIYQM